MVRNGYYKDPANNLMMQRISTALKSGTKLSVAQRNWVKHEAYEAKLVSKGMDQGTAHAEAGKLHPDYFNYDPDIIQAFPEEFNPNWFEAWGLKHPSR